MAENEKTSGAAWVEEMHAHFWEKGYYRTEDLQRLLGDPRAHVEVEVHVQLTPVDRPKGNECVNDGDRVANAANTPSTAG